jgi:hypothetical protein
MTDNNLKPLRVIKSARDTQHIAATHINILSKTHTYELSNANKKNQHNNLIYTEALRASKSARDTQRAAAAANGPQTPKQTKKTNNEIDNLYVTLTGMLLYFYVLE